MLGKRLTPITRPRVMELPAAMFENLQNCEYQSIMCCFGRDHQSEDNNGNCKLEKCGKNADPMDNSNLCWTEPSFTTYPNHEEGKTHCHGFAWAEDDNDFLSQLKCNNFFMFPRTTIYTLEDMFRIKLFINLETRMTMFPCVVALKTCLPCHDRIVPNWTCHLRSVLW
mmetsp:Transcript_29649/g.43832  ORF Transcript_29649/g.43832 Transcript_29649/m.43832 type:complete len:168 (+) Transcript_29649:884-1387(+)